VSFRREKFVPRGGPDGGDGGAGGDVILQVNPGLRTLLDFAYKQHFKAERGQHGQGSNKSGREGADRVIPVPAGTVVTDDSGALIADLVSPGQKVVVAKGGRGGRGNVRFATSTNRAPRRADPGEEGEERWLKLELRLLADVGLVGLPNAGKSTLISKVTAARPKIAAYPFTTLEPGLGMAYPEDHEPFVIADIPGLIEGASEGHGLGLKFLRHIERTRLIIHVLDLSQVNPEDPLQSLRAINHELAAFGDALAARPQILFLNKTDIAESNVPVVRDALERLGPDEQRPLAVFEGSALEGEGLTPLIQRVAGELENINASAVDLGSHPNQDVATEEEPF